MTKLVSTKESERRAFDVHLILILTAPLPRQERHE